VLRARAYAQPPQREPKLQEALDVPWLLPDGNFGDATEPLSE
jgi:hypothetical protein